MYLPKYSGPQKNDELQVLSSPYRRSTECVNRMRDRRSSYTFALLKVCRQIYTESHLLPVHLNVFRFHHPITLSAVLDTGVFPLISAIHTIRVYTEGSVIDKENYLISRLHDFKSLKRVEVAIAFYVPYAPEELEGIKKSTESRLKEAVRSKLEVAFKWGLVYSCPREYGR
ncbi:hypothetical protein CC86DRAFT_366764 [Ophiobolus disseminans]|uniref:Uncharacterized protein n=1 Tax=Ophiobolus disseminans TaxID=1469910 RepID=A0A6A7ADL0_9PLEO|nr:hypothetical protein CC86DRAFT_366764 [Ophiobolus disseminans]